MCMWLAGGGGLFGSSVRVCICSSCACCCIRVGLRWLGMVMLCPPFGARLLKVVISLHMRKPPPPHHHTTHSFPSGHAYPPRARMQVVPIQPASACKISSSFHAIPAPASGLVGEREVSSLTSSEPRCPNTAINTAACERKKTHAARALPLDASPPPPFRSRGHWRSDVCRVV
jgi:hypothetical protein